MNSFTQSAAKFFFDKYPQEASLFMFGHTEAITKEMCKEYIEWCRTDEGRSYLKGGANYCPNYSAEMNGNDKSEE